MRLLITAAILSVCAIPAEAGNRHHHHGAVHSAALHRGGGGIVKVSTAAGPITVASHLADRFKTLIADFVAPMSAASPMGATCDFDQSGWGMTAGFMYRARAIIAKHGFRDGCSFGDCGHVDDGRPIRYAHRSWGEMSGG